MRVALYVRVSTSEQSTDLQREELEAYAKARGWSEVKLYDDSGKSGTHERRPALQTLLADCKARKVDAVLTWKLDRLFRSLKHLLATLQELEDLGIVFISLRDQIDLSTASGRLMMQMLGAFGEFEASLIRERVKAGLRSAKAKGKQLGRTPTIDLSTVRQMRQKGFSMSKIAAEIGASKQGVSRALQRG